MILKKYFYFALLVLASLWVMPACSEDNDIPSQEVPEEPENPEDPGDNGGEHVPNPAGDDFYMFVNGEWHESLTNKEETQGYGADYQEMLSEKTEESFEYMEEYQMVLQSLQLKDAGAEKANIEKVEEIINEITGDIETKQDAYIAIGKCIRMGLLDDKFKLYIAYIDQKIHYTFGPEVMEEGEGEEEENARLYGFHRKPIRGYKKMSLQSRTADDALSAMIEGLDMDPEFFAYKAEFVDNTIDYLEGLSLEEMVEYIQSNIKTSLYPYCADELVSALTEGKINTTAEYFEVMRNDLFAYSIAYQFNQLYVTEENKAAFREYAEELRNIFAKRLENNAWLSAQTKQAALDKLAKMQFFFGGPDEWLEAGFPNPKGELLVDDIIEVKTSRTRVIEALLNEDITDKTMTILIFEPGSPGLNSYNAVYYAENNSANIFPALMMEPDFALDMDPWDMYAAFYVIGHEMTHGFDKDGSEYDGDGLENDWWTAEDKNKFLALNDMFSTQISTFEAAPGIMTDGERTNTEDVADLGGLNIAFDAMTEHLKKKGVTGDELKEAQKKFFIKHALRLCTNYSAEDLQGMLTDEHSVDKIRVNGIIQHMDSWYDLFNVVEGDALYLPKEERIVIW